MTSSSASPIFQDPRPFYGQDPHITPYRYGYLLIESQDERRIQIRQIPNLSDLHTNTTIVVHDDPEERQVWAPELHYFPEENRWFIYYAASDGNNETHRMYVLRSETSNPLSQYQFLGQIRTLEDTWGIDLTTFTHNKARYGLWSGWERQSSDETQHLYIAQMPTPNSLLGQTRLSSPTLPWERSQAPIIEGPQAYHTPSGQLLIFFAANASWTQHYATGLLRLKGTNPLGPAHWRKDPLPLRINAGHGHPIEGTEPTEFVYHTKLSAFHGWSDRVIETIPLADLLEGRRDANANRLP